MKRNKTRTIGLLVAVAVLGGDSACAVSVSYLLEVTDAFGPHADVFTVGESALVSYTLDGSATDSDPSPQAGSFLDAVLAFSVSFLDADILVMAGEAGGVRTFDNVFDSSGTWSDQLFFFAGPIVSGSMLGGEDVLFAEIDFTTEFLDPPEEPLLISSDELPLATLSLVDIRITLFLETVEGFTQVSFAPNLELLFFDHFESGDLRFWSSVTN